VVGCAKAGVPFVPFRRNVMLNSIPTKTHSIFKGVLKGLVVVCLAGMFYYAYQIIYERGVVAGIEAYHAQCLVGGYLIDDQGQAVICGPLSKAPAAEKETYKDKAKAPTLF
jgi:hypothetical protein